jgi:hypothetical protein
MSDLDAQRAARRAAMPTVSALLEEWSAMFPGTKVIYAVENGIRVGRERGSTGEPGDWRE